MMKRIQKLGLALCAAAVLLLPVGVRAEQEPVPSTGGEFIQSILGETDTSIVYDCGMYPAKQLAVNGLVHSNPKNQYKQLKTPAMVTKIKDDYMIVDTYHNQVIYSRSLQTPINEWSVLGGGLSLPHAIASDGSVYLVTDTEKHQVLVYEWRNGRYQNTQKLSKIGIRPHAIQYDEQTATFFVWSAHTGEMYLLKKEPLTGLVCIDQIRQVKELHGQYVRSFTVVDDTIWFPSGTNGEILVVDKNTFEVLYRYPVTDEIAGMASVMPYGGYVYMTVSTDLSFDQSKATMLRVQNPETLKYGIYEDIYDAVGRKGVPYYFEKLDTGLYVTTHGCEKSLWRLRMEADGSVKGLAVY